MNLPYDSTIDATKHIDNINWVWENVLKPQLDDRFKHHDESKLEDPEKACYDKYIPELKKVDFGTPEYDAIKKKMNEIGLNHHFEVNRHHPEHFENGISDMNLVDFIEHICDCYAASMRSDSSFEEGIEIVMKNNHYPEELKSIVRNTAKEVFKDQKPEQY